MVRTTPFQNNLDSAYLQTLLLDWKDEYLKGVLAARKQKGLNIIAKIGVIRGTSLWRTSQ